MSALAEARDRHAVLVESVPRVEGWRTMTKVIEHHAPVGGGDWCVCEATVVCRGCDVGQHAEGRPDWPCSTIRLIAADFHVILSA